MQKWTIEESREHYNINGWGAGYFDINEQGHVVVQSNPGSEHCIDLKLLVDDIQSKGYSLPALIRFSDILRSSIARLANSFQNSIDEYEYKGTYHGVYPIKVNQQRQVVEEIVKFGQPYNIGLEAGSKPELHAILAIMDNPEALLICNGYKDEPFIRLALMSQKLGKKVFIVVEKLDELDLIARVAREVGVDPNIGLRIKLVSAGSGRWATSAGEYSKFGLNPMELMDALDIAKKNNILDRIQLIHFHLGSQITNIRRIKTASRKWADSIPNCSPWVATSNTLMLAAGWAWIMTDRAPPIIPAPTILFRNMPTMWCTTCWKFASRTICRTPTSFPNQAAP